MSIGEDQEGLENVKAKLEEAWNTASEAKERFAEAQDLLMEVVGPVSNMPAMAGESNDSMEEAKEFCEKAQTLSTQASEQIDSYIEQITS